MIDPPGKIKRLVFFGTPDVSVPFLEALHTGGFEVALVVTGSDKRRSRRAELTASPIKGAAHSLDIPVTHNVQDALLVDAQLGVVVAFGQIIQPYLLDRLAMINVHFSLLPRWRGAAPVERAILAGDTTAGVCLMEVAEGLDTGRVYQKVELPISPQASAASLTADLVKNAVPMLLEALRTGLPNPQPQTGVPCYAHKITTKDLRLVWDQPAHVLHRQVRVGGAWTTWRNNPIKIWQAKPLLTSDVHLSDVHLSDVHLQHMGAAGTLVSSALLDTSEVAKQAGTEVAEVAVVTGLGLLQLIEVQQAGRTRQSAKDWLRGVRPQVGEQFH